MHDEAIVAHCKRFEVPNHVDWGCHQPILGLHESISCDAADNVSHPRRLDPTMELITYSFVLYLQHGRRDVKCKLSAILISFVSGWLTMRDNKL